MNNFSIADVPVQHHFCAGVYAKRMTLPAGHRAISHKHAYDHFGILAVGRAVVISGDEKTEYQAGDCIVITAGIEHEIEALDDIVWLCVHPTDETDPEKIDAVLIQGG